MKYQKQWRDGLSAIFLIAAFGTLVFEPYYWMYVHYEAATKLTPENPIGSFTQLNSIFWTAAANLPTFFHGLPGLFLALAFLTRRARTIEHGFVLPLGFTIIYLGLDYFVFGYIGFFSRSWWVALPAILIVSLPYYFLMRKWYSKGLELDNSITEMVAILSIVIIPLITVTFVNSMDMAFGSYYGLKYLHW